MRPRRYEDRNKPKKGTKRTSILFPIPLYDEMTKGDKPLGTTVVAEIHNSLACKKYGLLDLKGVFAPNEWVAMAIMLNGNFVSEPEFRYSRDMLISKCREEERLNQTFWHNGADVKTVCDKIAGLTHLQVSAIHNRIADYWETLQISDNPDRISIAEWAKL